MSYPNREELITTKEYWQVLIATAIWQAQNKRKSKRADNLAFKIVHDPMFMDTIKEISEKFNINKP